MGNSQNGKSKNKQQNIDPADTLIELKLMINSMKRSCNKLEKQIKDKTKELDLAIQKQSPDLERHHAKTIVQQQKMLGQFQGLEQHLSQIYEQIKLNQMSQDVMNSLTTKISPQLMEQIKNQDPVQLIRDSEQFFVFLQQFNTQTQAMQLVFKQGEGQKAYTDETDQLIQDRKIQFKIMNGIPVDQQTIQNPVYAKPQANDQTTQQPQQNQQFEDFLNGLRNKAQQLQ